VDAIGLILAAIIAGATAAVEPTTTDIVKEAYAGLKALIKRKWSHVAVEALEHDPASTAQRTAVEETLKKSGAGTDLEVLEKAKEVVAVVREYAPGAIAHAGIDISELEAYGNVTIEDLIGESVRLHGIRSQTGDIAIKRVGATNPSKR
jgi:hypothetical protein